MRWGGVLSQALFSEGGAEGRVMGGFVVALRFVALQKFLHGERYKILFLGSFEKRWYNTVIYINFLRINLFQEKIDLQNIN